MDILIEEFEDHDMSPFFVAGEEELAAMSKQLHELKAKEDHGKIYKADDIARANNDLEVILVEIADAFSRYNSVKTSFDNRKSMFAPLAMFKTLADKNAFASIDSFKKVKLLFLQPSGKRNYISIFTLQTSFTDCFIFVHPKDCQVHLWQMGYKTKWLLRVYSCCKSNHKRRKGKQGSLY